MWEGTHQYLFAFTYYKQAGVLRAVADFVRMLLMYRTALLRVHGGWSNLTMAEDMDLTWSLYQGGEVRFVPGRCAIDRAANLQAHGPAPALVARVHPERQAHWRGPLSAPLLRSAVAVAFWDATAAAALSLVPPRSSPSCCGRPGCSATSSTPRRARSVVVGAARRREMGDCMPAFFVLRTVNAIYFHGRRRRIRAGPHAASTDR
jgi:cellulose synthase/poly-beta-1,6-N-acetylglucosamine synthase-like glycosyltransferase